MPHIEPGCSIGICFEVSDFRGDGVASGFELAGPKDFPDPSGYSLRVQNGLQICEISPRAQTNGDAGITRSIEAAEGEVYSLLALGRIREARGRFKARLTLAARRRRGRQLEEWNAPLKEALPDWSEMLIEEAVMPPGTVYLTAKFRAHTRTPGESGIAEVSKLVLTRLA